MAEMEHRLFGLGRWVHLSTPADERPKQEQELEAVVVALTQVLREAQQSNVGNMTTLLAVVTLMVREIQWLRQTTDEFVWWKREVEGE